MNNILKRHHISFKHALEGILWAFSTQPNFKIHILLTLIVIGLGFYFDIKVVEWVILIFCITLGLTIEMANTALESVTDLITREWRKEAKIAKDVAAAMMLTVAMGTALVAVLVFSPYIVRLIK